jgi:hypothetical protein
MFWTLISPEDGLQPGFVRVELFERPCIKVPETVLATTWQTVASRRQVPRFSPAACSQTMVAPAGF